MHVAEQGRGRAVLLCHGFPESWYSWRHQLPALAAAGYRAIAPDMRGYGQTDRPGAIEAYTMLHHVGDMVGLLDALGEKTAVIVGHDWGAPVAWNAALMRPDRFPAAAVLSVPYSPRGSIRPTAALARAAGEHFMYMLYFQEPGVAEAELGRDVRATLRRVLCSASGDAPAAQRWRPVMPGTTRFLDALGNPERLPAWLTEADLDFYAAEFQRTGFSGGLSWYRAMDLSWELMAAYQHAKVMQPALFVAGERDLVIAMQRRALDRLHETVPNLRRLVLLPGCGHWTQQERPAEVNAELLSFLRGVEG
ncbi:MAG: alpha/beta hydrolase [Candidatus Rokubacteria bacterium]|nr:alpha/beta hydrolase [Candidatus Rokubacteria bacterium]